MCASRQINSVLRNGWRARANGAASGSFVGGCSSTFSLPTDQDKISCKPIKLQMILLRIIYAQSSIILSMRAGRAGRVVPRTAGVN